MPIDTVAQLNDDQQNTQYEIRFPNGIPFSTLTPEEINLFTLRSDESFDPPEKSVGTYSIMFRGRKIEKTNLTEESAKEYTISFRLDQQWLIHDSLQDWLDQIQNNTTGGEQIDLSTRTDIDINVFNMNDVHIRTHRYRYSKIRALKISTFEHQGDTAMRVECTFIFLNDETIEI